MSTELATIQRPLNEIADIAIWLANSKFGGVKSVDEAGILMLFCQSHGYDPIRALELYHVMSVGGKVQITLKATAIQAAFQRAGGRVLWRKRTDDECEVLLKHPQYCSAEDYPEHGGFLLRRTRAEMTYLTNKDGPWQTHKTPMLAKTTMVEAIRAVAPELLEGGYIEEELVSDDKPLRTARNVTDAAGAPVHAPNPHRAPVIVDGTVLTEATAKLKGTRELFNVLIEQLASPTAEIIAECSEAIDAKSWSPQALAKLNEALLVAADSIVEPNAPASEYGDAEPDFEEPQSPKAQPANLPASQTPTTTAAKPAMNALEASRQKARENPGAPQSALGAPVPNPLPRYSVGQIRPYYQKQQRAADLATMHDRYIAAPHWTPAERGELEKLNLEHQKRLGGQ